MLPVVLSTTAVETFTSIRAQILERFGSDSAEQFEKRTFETLERVSHSPLIYKASIFGKTIRSGRVNNICSVFYEIKEDRIEVLFFWDNRQEPML